MNQTTPSLAITWEHPTFLLPLFCLASLLGCTDSLAAGIGLSFVMLGVMLVTCVMTQLVTRVSQASSLTWLMLCSGIITLLELLLHAFAYALYRKLGLYLPLSVIGALLMTREELLMPQLTLATSLKRALVMSGGFALAALVLGTGRELVGHGSLLADAGELFGAWATPLAMQFFRPDMGFLLGILAPGAFVALGLGVALYNQLFIKMKLLKP